MTVYERKVKVQSSIAVKADILRILRRLVLPHEKFVTEGSGIWVF